MPGAGWGADPVLLTYGRVQPVVLIACSGAIAGFGIGKATFEGVAGGIIFGATAFFIGVDWLETTFFEERQEAAEDAIQSLKSL